MADLLARGLQAYGPLMLLDGAPGLFSPRRTLPRDVGGIATVHVGDDGWYRVVAPETPTARHDPITTAESFRGRWATFVVDTYDPVLVLLHARRWHQFLTWPWVRVVLATASATGPLQQAVAAAGALRQAGVPRWALTAAVVDVSSGRIPSPALAKITLLGADCGYVGRVPHLPGVRAAGRIEGRHVSKQATRAAAILAQRVAIEEAA